MAVEILPLLNSDLTQRFWEKVEKSAEGCWGWKGAKTMDGYGQLAIKRRPRLAHRISYALHRGVEPGSMVVMHICDQPECCNPDHLKLAPQRDNLADMHAKQRAAIGVKHGRAKLSAEDAQAIKAKLRRGFSQDDIAREFGVSQSLVSHIKRGRIWKN